VIKGRPVSDFLWLMIGPIIWAAHLFLSYGIETMVCVFADSSFEIARALVLMTTVAALFAMAFAVRLRGVSLNALLFLEPAERKFAPFLGGALLVLSAIAVLWTTFPAVVLRACHP
jgi:hypothetical protein